MAIVAFAKRPSVATMLRCIKHTSTSRALCQHNRNRLRRRNINNVTRTSSQEQAGSAPNHNVRVTLKKPVGIVFAQKPEGGPVYVDELVEGGAAASTGRIQVGDILRRCSAVILKSGEEGVYEKEGYGQRLYDNWERVIFDCDGQDFKTVMAALRSNTERWGFKDIILEFSKPAAQ